jgi:hypothetical protein
MTYAKTHSAVEPTWYFLDEIQTKDGMLVLILRINWNIVATEVPEPEPHSEWQYDSVLIKHEPEIVLEETEVRTYIETHEQKLKEQALKQYTSGPISNVAITEIREQELVPEFEEKIFSEKEVYGATIMEIDVTRSDKRYVRAKLLNRTVEKWCYVTGSVYRDYTESKIGVGTIILILYDPDNTYPVVVDRVVL